MNDQFMGLLDEVQIYNYAIDTSLLANWKFDESSGTTVSDSAGTNTGTALSGTTIVNGYSGNARSFSGVNSGITFNSTVIPIGAKSIRFKIKTSSQAIGVLFSNIDDYSTQHGDFVMIGSGKIRWLSGCASSTSRFCLESLRIVNDGNWHDIVLKWDGTTELNKVNILIDGVLDAQGTANSIENHQQSKNLAIGKYLNYMNGKCFKR